MLILSRFQEVIIIFELLDCLLIAFMFFLDLFLCVKVDLDIDVINNITSIFIGPLRMWKYAFVVGDMKLIDQDLHYFS